MLPACTELLRQNSGWMHADWRWPVNKMSRTEPICTAQLQLQGHPHIAWVLLCAQELKSACLQVLHFMNSNAKTSARRRSCTALQDVEGSSSAGKPE